MNRFAVRVAADLGSALRTDHQLLVLINPINFATFHLCLLHQRSRWYLSVTCELAGIDGFERLTILMRLHGTAIEQWCYNPSLSRCSCAVVHEQTSARAMARWCQDSCGGHGADPAVFLRRAECGHRS